MHHAAQGATNVSSDCVDKTTIHVELFMKKNNVHNI